MWQVRCAEIASLPLAIQGAVAKSIDGAPASAAKLLAIEGGQALAPVLGALRRENINADVVKGKEPGIAGTTHAQQTSSPRRCKTTAGSAAPLHHIARSAGQPVHCLHPQLGTIASAQHGSAGVAVRRLKHRRAADGQGLFAELLEIAGSPGCTAAY